MNTAQTIGYHLLVALTVAAVFAVPAGSAWALWTDDWRILGIPLLSLFYLWMVIRRG